MPPISEPGRRQPSRPTTSVEITRQVGLRPGHCEVGTTSRLLLKALAYGLVAAILQCKPPSQVGAGSDSARAPIASVAPPVPVPTVVRPASAGRTRPSAIAGSWYPGERPLLMAETARRLRTASAAPSLPSKPIAMIVPHAGWRYSGDAAASAFRNLHPGDYARVVLIGPSHAGSFEGFAIGEWDAYRTPLGDIPVCAEAAALHDSDSIRSVPNADQREHSLEIELPFLQQTLRSFCLIPVLAGQTTQVMERALAEKLAKLHDGKTLFLASSDFTHYGPRYGYMPFGPSAVASHDAIAALQSRAIGILGQKDSEGFRRFLDSTDATICGRRGISVLLELLPKIAPKAGSMLLAHYASSELPGSREENGVWYVALAYIDGVPTKTYAPMGVPPEPRACKPESPLLDQPAGQKLVRIARATLRTELLGSEDLQQELASLPSSSEIDRVQAVFVTLKKAGELRGCVGQIEPQYPLPEAIVHAAIDAAEHDGRFSPVTGDELEALQLEVTALTPPRPVASWRQIELGKHGIVLTNGNHRALFLPQVAGEQGWTLEQTLRALSHKARLPEEAWRDRETSFAVFSGQVFEEESSAERPRPGARAH
jgi:MEMO1 family protein